MNFLRKSKIKDILNSIPYAPDLYWRIRGRELSEGSRFSLEYLRRELPEITAQLKPFIDGAQSWKENIPIRKSPLLD